MARYQRRNPSSGRERDQDWNDRSRSWRPRDEQRWNDEERYARSGYEQDFEDVDYDREVEASRPRGEYGERDWRERERGYGREGARYGREGGAYGGESGGYGREGQWGGSGYARESGWGREGSGYGREGSYGGGREGQEGRYGQGRPSWGSEGGMGRGESESSSFGGRDPSWRYGGSAYEPYYRAGRNRPEGRGSERHHGSGFSGVADYGSNLGFSGGTASLGFGEDVGEAPGISGFYSGARTGYRSSSAPSMRRGQHAGKGPKDFRRSDDRLREEISERLMADPDIDASEMSISVKEGEVTLEGTVPDRQTKRDAEDCIEVVLGVRQVNNRLRVSDSSQRGGSNISRGHEVGSQQRGQQGSQQQGGQTNQPGQSSSSQPEHRPNRITGKNDPV